MEWLKAKTSIGGSEVSNWVLVLGALVIIYAIVMYFK
jgi:hypothetical protein